MMYLTSRLENEAIENISLTSGMVQKDEVLVRKGSVVNDEVYQKTGIIQKSI